MKELARIPPGCTLGLNYTCMHDAAIAVVGPDGQALFACALERLTRTKQDGRWPSQLLNHVPFDRIDTIAIGSLEMPEAESQGGAFRRTDWPVLKKRDELELKPVEYSQAWHELIASLPEKRTLRFDHHHCHAASAYYLTNFDNALVLTSDSGAFQCQWSFGAYRAEGDVIEQLAGMHFREYATPGHLYTLVTVLLGHRPNRHEGKVTGLAARATVTDAEVARFEAIAWPMVDELFKLIRWDICDDLPNAPTCVVNEANRQLWRAEFHEFTNEQMAACVQRVLETSMSRLVDHVAREHVELKNVCLAGGVFANVLLNQKIIRKFDQGFVAPPMTDDGIALGAAFLGHTAVRPKNSPRRFRATMYLGPGIEDVSSTLDAAGLVYDKPADTPRRVAELLSEGKVVAVARGRMEFGPRALGHRSVLAPAVDVGINDRLNARLQRTEFMPFAPMVLRRDAAELLTDLDRIQDSARFMTVTADCSDALREEAPAVVHLDGTARPQIVDVEDEPFCARVLEEYSSLTGRRAIVNTSFNVHEQPIVCSVEDALLGFAQTRLDNLCIEDVLVPLEGNEAALEAYLERPRTELPAGTLEPDVALGRWVNTMAEHHLAESALRWEAQGQLDTQLQASAEIATSQAKREEQFALDTARLAAERDAALDRAQALEAELHELMNQLKAIDAARAGMAGLLHLRESDLQRIREAVALIESTVWTRLGRRLRLISARAE